LCGTKTDRTVKIRVSAGVKCVTRSFTSYLNQKLDWWH